MGAMELCRSFDIDRYNGLGSVENADGIVRADGQLDELLNRASWVFVKHGVQRRFGIALLHRHYSCDNGERMSQTQQTLAGEVALVTEPVVGDLDYVTQVPWLWTVSDRHYYPLEFTSDDVACGLFQDTLQVPKQFFQDFANLLETSPIGHMIGLAIVERELHKGISDEHMLMEYSAGDERRSTIYVRHLNDAVDSIVTTWGFREVINPTSGCVEPETGCQPVYKCVCEKERGEDGKTKHVHQPRKDHRQVRGQHNPS